MAAENRLWGQKRMQAELALLGFQVSARTVAKYMHACRRQGPTGTWREFLTRHASSPPVSPPVETLVPPSVANLLWGAPRIHGELLKLGIDVGQTTVAKIHGPEKAATVAGWKTFLRNHADGIASIDMFVVKTLSSRPGCCMNAGPAAFAAEVLVVGRNGTSKCRMDCPLFP